MIVIGKDTEKFLERETKIKEYLTVIDKDFQEIGVNKNYIVLTHLEIPEEPVNPDEELRECVVCLCFYFTHIPKSIKIENTSNILADHSDMLTNLSVFTHFAQIEESEILELGENPGIEARAELFLRTVYR